MPPQTAGLFTETENLHQVFMTWTHPDSPAASPLPELPLRNNALQALLNQPAARGWVCGWVGERREEFA
jgi:hypothetical protein